MKIRLLPARWFVGIAVGTAAFSVAASSMVAEKQWRREVVSLDAAAEGFHRGRMITHAPSVIL